MTYWHYTYTDGKGTYGYGVQKSSFDSLDFNYFHKKNPSSVILSVTKISRKQHDLLVESINKYNDNQ